MPATSAPRSGDRPTIPVAMLARMTVSRLIARKISGFLVRAAWANNGLSIMRPTASMAKTTSTPSEAVRISSPISPWPPISSIRNSIGTSARSSKTSMAKAVRPTGPSVPEMGRTRAVEDMASARPRAMAAGAAVPLTNRPAEMSRAQPISSALPVPSAVRPMLFSRRKLMCSPAENSSRTMPSSANGSMPSGSLIEKVWSQGWSWASAPSM